MRPTLSNVDIGSVKIDFEKVAMCLKMFTFAFDWCGKTRYIRLPVVP